MPPCFLSDALDRRRSVLLTAGNSPVFLSVRSLDPNAFAYTISWIPTQLPPFDTLPKLGRLLGLGSSAYKSLRFFSSHVHWRHSTPSSRAFGRLELSSVQFSFFSGGTLDN